MVRDGLCCNQTRTSQPFQAMGLDFVLINGILQPIIRAEARLPAPSGGPPPHVLCSLFERGHACRRAAQQALLHCSVLLGWECAPVHSGLSTT